MTATRVTMHENSYMLPHGTRCTARPRVITERDVAAPADDGERDRGRDPIRAAAAADPLPVDRLAATVAACGAAAGRELGGVPEHRERVAEDRPRQQHVGDVREVEVRLPRQPSSVGRARPIHRPPVRPMPATRSSSSSRTASTSLRAETRSGDHRTSRLAAASRRDRHRAQPEPAPAHPQRAEQAGDDQDGRDQHGASCRARARPGRSPTGRSRRSHASRRP